MARTHDPYVAEFTITDWQDAASRLAWSGYVRAHNEIDAKIATKGRCPLCGKALTYVGRRLISTYRAFAVCVPCNQGVEF